MNDDASSSDRSTDHTVPPAHAEGPPKTTAARSPGHPSKADGASQDEPTRNSTAGSWDGSGRTFWFSGNLNDKTLRHDPRRRTRPDEANLIASLTDDGAHMPTLDIDHPARLEPSSSPGHYHLFIDTPMTWRAYRRLLRALYLGGVIGRNAYWRSLDRGASFVRPPGVFKTETELLRAKNGRTGGRRAATRALWATRIRVTGKRVLWLLHDLRSAAASVRPGRRRGK